MESVKQFFEKLFHRGPKIERVDIRKRFDLIGRVGQGSMSKVWRARDVVSGRMVALKVLDKEKTLRLESRFQKLNKPKEGEVAITLRHPNVVKTLEHGITLDDEQFLVMEFIEGVGLSYLVDVQNERMQKNRLSYMIQLGDAIDYLHRQNYIHRDICPRNVVVGEDDVLKLIDFGLVVPNTPPFQAPGNRTGTANYMAPELISRQRTDTRIDIFSYAVTCYEMVCKRLPWPATDSFESALAHVNNPPDDIRDHATGIDSQVADAIMKGLARFPADRWQRVSLMVEEFRQAAQRLGLPDGPPARNE
ncbi:MAG: serine/threonine-protein kinase [Planctomycetaceae bacterium]